MFFKFLKNLCKKNNPPIEEEAQLSAGTTENVSTETVESEDDTNLGQTTQPKESPNFFVLLDNGHAKSTAGKRSPMLPNGERFYEWEFNRDIVKRISEGLDKLNIKYHILVPEVEKDVSLSERAKRANEYCKEYGTKNCFFISVHSNAYGDGSKWESPKGWGVWTTVGITKSDD